MVYQMNFNDLPVVRNLRIMQGDSYREPYELWLNAVPLSLADATITVAVRRGPGKGKMVYEAEIEPDSAGDGQFTVVVPASATEGLLGEYCYEVEILWNAEGQTFPGGCTKTVLAGALVVSEDVLH